MKAKIIISLSIFVIGFMVVNFLFFNAFTYSSGSPGGYTGAPNDGLCTSCHYSSTVTSKTGWITSDIPVSGYIPDSTYTIIATGTNTGVSAFGFEVTSVDTAGAFTGTLIATNSTETKLVSSSESITHTSGGITPSGDSKSWSFDWTAPSTGTGDVTFYGAFISGMGTGYASAPTFTSTLTVQEFSVVTCTYSISSSSQSFTASGGSDSITVTTTDSSCTWTATSSASWISITSGSSGNGNGTVAYTVSVNTNSTQRTDSITVEGETYTITQAGENITNCSGTPPIQPSIQNNDCNLAASSIVNVTYLWYLDGNEIVGATTQYYTTTSEGYYTVKVTDNNSCSTTSEPFYVNCIINGINKSSIIDNQFKVYPNPSNGQFTLKIQNNELRMQNTKMIVYNILGKVVYQSKIQNIESKIVNLKSKGIYTLQVISDERIVGNKKIVVE